MGKELYTERTVKRSEDTRDGNAVKGEGSRLQLCIYSGVKEHSSYTEDCEEVRRYEDGNADRRQKYLMKLLS